MDKPGLSPSEVTVMLLAAGRGTRMRTLTRTTPKPLLMVGERSLIEHHLARLSEMKFQTVIINIAYLSEQIRSALGDGSRFGLQIHYSDESECGALETAGGIRNALPIIKTTHLLVINSDIWTDFDFSSLLQQPDHCAARLVLVENPEHNQQGDFWVSPDGALANQPLDGYRSRTFSGIALYKKSLFAQLPTGKLALGPLLHKWIDQGKVGATEHAGTWTDAGTPERLAFLNPLS